jgi:hypothetical protein
MRSLLTLLLVGSLIAIGMVLFGGVGDLYELGDIVVLPGSRVLIAGFAVLGGAAAALFSWGESAVVTERGIETRLAFRPALIAIAAILFAVVGFVILDPGSNKAASELFLGDCFNDPPASEVHLVEAIPCSEPHDNEVFAIVMLTGFSEEFPGQAVIDEEAGFECLRDFGGYVGTQYENSILDIAYLTPTRNSWAEGDRRVTCAVYRLDGRRMTDSIRGSGV